MPSSPSLDVLLIDDVPSLRLLVAVAMAADPALNLVGEASDGWTGIQLADKLTPDVVVLDLKMPEMDGLEALPVLRALLPGARILVWTVADEVPSRARALELGADAVFAKTENPQLLVRAMRADNPSSLGTKRPLARFVPRKPAAAQA